MADETYDLGLLERSLAKWRSSPALRLVYADIYRAMAVHAPPGPALEVGSGIGVMREIVPGVRTSDIRRTPHVDLAASAYALEEAAGGPWSAIYMLDVLHHLREPFRFFASAARALVPGGRVILCEPAATPVGRWVYRACHHEPTAPERIVRPYVLPSDDDSGGFANMGMAWALFVRDRARIEGMLGSLGLRVVCVVFRDLAAYLLSGGYSGPAMAPESCLRWLLAAERRLPQWVLRQTALRTIVVVEREPRSM